MNTSSIRSLKKKDKTLAKLMERVGPMRFKINELQSPFEALAESIVYQQLSGKAAATIFSRFKALFPKAKKFPKPKEILALSDEKLRSAGLSGAKSSAIKDLATKMLEGIVPSPTEIFKLSNEEIIERLTVIRGVGRWTVEMLLIFRLGREDILPSTDYGIRKGFALTYKKRELPSPKDLSAFGERWAPHRTTASWYLWRSLDLPRKKNKKKK